MTKVKAPRVFLSHWRAERGFTQEHLGNILGVGKSAISRWENGERQMDLADIEKIAEIFGIEPVALFMAPADMAKAKAISDFARLIEEIGVDRAELILKALMPTKD